MAWSPWFCSDNTIVSVISPWSWHGLYNYAMIMLWPQWIFFHKCSDEIFTVNQVIHAIILGRQSASERHCITHDKTHNKKVVSNGSQKKQTKHHIKSRGSLFWLSQSKKGFQKDLQPFFQYIHEEQSKWEFLNDSISPNMMPSRIMPKSTDSTWWQGRNIEKYN